MKKNKLKELIEFVGLSYKKEMLKKADSKLREIDEEYRTTIVNMAKYGTTVFTTAMITELAPEEQNQITMYIYNSNYNFHISN